jgi:hypothetical protein
MKLLAFTILFAVLTSAVVARKHTPDTPKPGSGTPMLTRADIQSVSPALDRYTGTRDSTD